MRIVLALLSLLIVVLSFTSCGTSEAGTNDPVRPSLNSNVTVKLSAPYFGLQWGDSIDDVYSALGSEPDSEYDQGNSHFIVYEGKNYDGKEGRFIFQLDNEGLYLIRFICSLSTETAEFFLNQYTEKYGQPEEPYENTYIWDTKDNYIAISVGLRDAIWIEIEDPSQR